jgi:hypothetical protein
LFVLYAGFTLLLGEDTPTSSLSGVLVRSVTKLASITFLSLAFSYWIDYLGFITEEKLAAVLITPSLGVPNWPVIYIINTAPSTSFLAPLPGSEEEGEEAPTSTKRQQNIMATLRPQRRRRRRPCHGRAQHSGDGTWCHRRP